MRWLTSRDMSEPLKVARDAAEIVARARARRGF
ncbi:MAG: hypothetical protein ACJAZ8_002682 [Planctomycetota bacterium]|jgi:hypothetical protein